MPSYCILVSLHSSQDVELMQLGYVIPYPNMRYYFRWIPYISRESFLFKSLR